MYNHLEFINFPKCYEGCGGYCCTGFKNNNFKIVNNPKEAEIIVINTCGFIEPAKQEAINTILEMSEYKNKKWRNQHGKFHQ